MEKINNNIEPDGQYRINFDEEKEVIPEVEQKPELSLEELEIEKLRKEFGVPDHYKIVKYKGRYCVIDDPTKPYILVELFRSYIREKEKDDDLDYLRDWGKK